MKKLSSILLAVLSTLFLLASCSPGSNSDAWSDVPAVMEITENDFTINGGGDSWSFWQQKLNEKLYGKKATITFSCDMLIENSTSDTGYLMWQVNNQDGTYPKIATCPFNTSEAEKLKDADGYISVSGKESVKIESGAIFYLSNYNENTDKTFTNANFKITVKNFKLKIDYIDQVPVGLSEDDYWLNAPSLKEAAMKAGFEHFGLVPSANELLNDPEKQQGLKRHASSITMGNELKPDSFFAMGWGNNTQIPNVTGKTKFTGSNGKEITVPDTLNGFSTVDRCLAKTKELGLKMRGHVLVWYSQTPKAFFCEDYNANKAFVKADEMTARQEWYIKTVLEHVSDWEAENMPEGEHIIYAWDVVNEALSDGATTGAFLRAPGNSNWATVYGKENYEYIINAFRFANKYAPEDVLLAYNDYNEFDGAKHQGYLKILDTILVHKDDAELPTRIDIAGMQSHNQASWPSASTYENAIKAFIKKGLDVQVTELDITGPAADSSYQTFKAPSDADQKKAYKEYFKIYRKYAKKPGSHGVSGVTIWGINDEDSWRSSGKPLLFRKISGRYYAKPSYHGVMEALE
ncbi:MAG: endo-1,4-beta-xylanase [Treponema sp.]|nr:endo-1,4-beta-xylanase [Treponema sp.]